MSIQPDIPTVGSPQQRLTQQLADLQRTVSQLQANSNTIPPGGVANTQIKSGTITTNEIAAGTITATNIAALAITTGLIAAGAVTAAKIAAGTITASEIAAGTITADRMNVSTLSSITANLGSVTAGTVTGATIQTSATGGRVVMSTTGISAYDASSVRQVFIDASTGLITANGVFLAQPGSTVPWQTTNFFIGGGNLLSNASAEDPTTTTQTLYMTGGTAGTFTLQYGAGTISAALNWNTTAAAVQTALNATGVLPAGVTAACSGGPLPGTPISIVLTGTSTPAASVLTIPAQSIIGGTVGVGAVPVGWTNGTNAGVDFVSGSAMHGGKIFRTTATGSSPQLAMNGRFSANWATGTNGTPYTFSAYLASSGPTRTATLIMQWYNVSNALVSTDTFVTTALNASTWQRFTLTARPPATATSLLCLVQYNSAVAGEVYYADALQLEVGDAPTAFSPRGDEILANTVQANMINVAQLSAISANMGTVTAGTITGVTITGATIQTSSSNPKLSLTTSGLSAIDGSGAALVTLDASNGLALTSGTGRINQVDWFKSGNQKAGIWAQDGINTNSSKIFLAANRTDGTSRSSTLTVVDDPVAGYSQIVASATDNTGTTLVATILDSLGKSSFVQNPVGGVKRVIIGGSSSISFSASAAATTTVTHGLGTTPSSVVCTGQAVLGSFVVNVSNITSTTFDATGVLGTSTTATLTFYWIAYA